MRVISWGNTDDTNSHEYVEVTLALLSAHFFRPLFIKGMEELGKKLAEKAIDETTSEFVKWIISQFTKKQKEKKIQDFTITLKDKTFLNVDIPQNTSAITIHFKDGEVTSVKYELDNK